mmetsp:Transcript_17795/g.20181  ORF Transcript_17795/g.20181 Transcript_17795/m.20181 type:complete len:194 (+) Transcript_17795:96-677(+)
MSEFFAKKREDEEGSGDEGDPEEEVTGNYKPLVTLPEVEVKTGEEQEVIVFKIRCKLYRWNDNQWKERGLGDIKLLRHKENKKTRVLMRQEKTLKIVANHSIEEDPLCELKPNVGSDKSWVWMARDFADGESADEKLAAKFANPENANKFKEFFEKSKASNIKIKEGGEPELLPEWVDEDKEEKDEKKEEKKE